MTLFIEIPVSQFMRNRPISHHAAAITLHFDGGNIGPLINQPSIVLGLGRHSNLGKLACIQQWITLDLPQSSLISHEGHYKPPWTKSPDDIVDERRIGCQFLIGLKTGIRRSFLGSNVHGVIGLVQNCIHGVSTRFKCTCIKQCSRTKSINSCCFGLFHRNSLHCLLLCLTLFLPLIFIIVKQVCYVQIKVKHHNVQYPIVFHIWLATNSLISHKHKPVVIGNGPKSIPISVQLFTKSLVPIEVFQLLGEASMGKTLIIWEVKVLTTVSNPVQLQVKPPS
mmetsp:Transcript_8991/g.16956  ORF Transcript_8991/g.16956 Transcript_8991/m.16956 type:complete len:280 (+) Transcript_8991:204-1043(+)